MSLLFTEPNQPYGRGRMPPSWLLDELDIDDGTLPEVLWRAAVLADEWDDPEEAEAGRPLSAVEPLAPLRPPEDEAWRGRPPP
jgi:hypothetical protein